MAHKGCFQQWDVTIYASTVLKDRFHILLLCLIIFILCTIIFLLHHISLVSYFLDYNFYYFSCTVKNIYLQTYWFWVFWMFYECPLCVFDKFWQWTFLRRTTKKQHFANNTYFYFSKALIAALLLVVKYFHSVVLLLLEVWMLLPTTGC